MAAHSAQKLKVTNQFIELTGRNHGILVDINWGQVLRNRVLARTQTGKTSQQVSALSQQVYYSY